MKTIDNLPAASDEPLPRIDSRQCFHALIEHWAKARIDGPMQAVARYDDAAKQLVTIGGLMQGVLVAAYSLMGRQPGAAPTSALQLVLVLSFLTALILFFVCAAGVCWTQPKMESREIYQFLMKTLTGCFNETDIRDLVKGWCVDIDTIRRVKRRWMMWASGSFILSSVLMMALLLLPLAAV